jgi:integrase
MAKGRLTDVAIKAAKAGDKLRKLSDGVGLQLWLDPRGYRSWRFAYRFDGKQRVLALGVYPAVSLSAARVARDEAKALLRERRDPSAVRRIDKLTRKVAAENTFKVVADELLARKTADGKAEATLDKVAWLLDVACEQLGSRPVSEISAAEVLGVLRTVERRGRLETARRLRSTIGQVFRYAIATARLENDPTQALRGALAMPVVTHRAAITDPVALGALLCAIDGYAGQPETMAALKLLPLVVSRPGELRHARWQEFDLDKATWCIPAARTKMRRDFDVALSRQALAILDALRTVTGHRELVFPGLRTADRPISENTLNAAMRRLGFAADEMTAHGFRASFSTLANESGLWRMDVIERCLAHAEPNAVRRAYNRAEFWPERVRLMQWWADHLDGLKAGQGSNVSTGRGRRATTTSARSRRRGPE